MCLSEFGTHLEADSNRCIEIKLAKQGVVRPEKKPGFPGFFVMELLSEVLSDEGGNRKNQRRCMGKSLQMWRRYGSPPSLRRGKSCQMRRSYLVSLAK